MPPAECPCSYYLEILDWRPGSGDHIGTAKIEIGWSIVVHDVRVRRAKDSGRIWVAWPSTRVGSQYLPLVDFICGAAKTWHDEELIAKLRERGLIPPDQIGSQEARPRVGKKSGV